MNRPTKIPLAKSNAGSHGGQSTAETTRSSNLLNYGFAPTTGPRRLRKRSSNKTEPEASSSTETIEMERKNAVSTDLTDKEYIMNKEAESIMELDYELPSKTAQLSLSQPQLNALSFSLSELADRISPGMHYDVFDEGDWEPRPRAGSWDHPQCNGAEASVHSHSKLPYARRNESKSYLSKQKSFHKQIPTPREHIKTLDNPRQINTENAASLEVEGGIFKGASVENQSSVESGYNSSMSISSVSVSEELKHDDVDQDTDIEEAFISPRSSEEESNPEATLEYTRTLQKKISDVEQRINSLIQGKGSTEYGNKTCISTVRQQVSTQENTEENTSNDSLREKDLEGVKIMETADSRTFESIKENGVDGDNVGNYPCGKESRDLNHSRDLNDNRDQNDQRDQNNRDQNHNRDQSNKDQNSKDQNNRDQNFNRDQNYHMDQIHNRDLNNVDQNHNRDQNDRDQNHNRDPNESELQNGDDKDLRKSPFQLSKLRKASFDFETAKKGPRPGIRRRATLVSFRPPRQSSGFSETNDSEVLEMDEVAFVQYLTDVRAMKTMLLKLKRELQEADVASPLLRSATMSSREATPLASNTTGSGTSPSTGLPRRSTYDASQMQEKLRRIRSASFSRRISARQQSTDSESSPKPAEGIIEHAPETDKDDVKSLKEELERMKSKVKGITQERDSLARNKEEVEHELESKNYTIKLLQKQLERQDSSEEMAYLKRQVKLLTEQVCQQQNKMTELRYRASTLPTTPSVHFNPKKGSVKLDIKNRLRDAFTRHLEESAKSNMLLSKHIAKAELTISEAQKGLKSIYSSTTTLPHTTGRESLTEAAKPSVETRSPTSPVGSPRSELDSQRHSWSTSSIEKIVKTWKDTQSHSQGPDSPRRSPRSKPMSSSERQLRGSGDHDDAPHVAYL